MQASTKMICVPLLPSSFWPLAQTSLVLRSTIQTQEAPAASMPAIDTTAMTAAAARALRILLLIIFFPSFAVSPFGQKSIHRGVRLLTGGERYGLNVEIWRDILQGAPSGENLAGEIITPVPLASFLEERVNEGDDAW